MTKFNLFLDLLYSINQLLIGGLTEDNITDTRLLLDHSFKRFEESNSTDVPELGVVTQTLCIVEQLKEIDGKDKPLLNGILTILDALLAVGVNSCNVRVARLEMHTLFDKYL